MSFLYAYPDWVIFVVVVTLVAIMSVLVMLVLGRILPHDDTKETFDLALRIMAGIVAINTFMLAFSVVQARNRITQVEREVTLEARSLGELHRLLLHYDGTGTASIRALLVRYAQSIVDDEWPAMSEGKESKKTMMMARELVKNTAKLEPNTARQQAVYAELLRAVDEVEDRRDSRLAGMDGTLPALFWVVIIALTLLGMTTGALFRPKPITIFMVAGQGAAIGLLIAFILTLDEPFLGDATVTSAPYQRVIQELVE